MTQAPLLRSVNQTFYLFQPVGGPGVRGVVGVSGDEWRAPGGRSMKNKPGKWTLLTKFSY